MTTIGFIGAGQIGGTLARLAVAHGYDVIVSNSRGPATLTDLVSELGDRARAATPAEAAAGADLVVVTIPVKAVPSVPVAELAGKLVIDTNNYYPQRDGQIAVLDEGATTVSGYLQQHLPTSSVVKAFNNIYYGDLGSLGVPAGSPDRLALSVAGDDPDARQAVIGLIDELGFDAVDVGPLAESWRFEKDHPAYGLKADLAGMTNALAQA
ncbi:NADPH-dependent F420 reductase [Cellulomonas sp. URHD0024]|uniref:NADPH-dependent F420 reductase n=1 Tax=Cellulomonas sp. URHD0024 TaxID=1302620 RepID=UPI0003F7DB2B|nr:NAD(P)-binding domain-containing protein [Cellulomonas sp. URHD0024]